MSRSSLASKFSFWWFGGGVTPVLIPNTAVKPSCADGSRKARVGRRQNKTFDEQESRHKRDFCFVDIPCEVELPLILSIYAVCDSNCLLDYRRH
jgi:hypothetical protein